MGPGPVPPPFRLGPFVGYFRPMEETAPVDPKSCSHMDGAASLLRPDERNARKVSCLRCGERWWPVRGEVWVHKDEIEAAVDMAAGIR